MDKIYKIYQNRCERRVLDEIKLVRYLEENDYICHNDNDTNIDIVIYISCGMRSEECKNKLNSLMNQFLPKSKIIVYGCWPGMEKISEANVYCVPLRQPGLLDTIIDAKKAFCEISYPNTNDRSHLNFIGSYYTDPRQYSPHCKDIYSVKVSEGCSGKCSYCGIKLATGPLKSRLMDEIIEDFKKGIESGFTVFRFQCENLGTYGIDIGLNIGILLNKIGEIHTTFHIDMPDLHPYAFTEYYDEILSFLRKKYVYLMHLPIQSGSQKILKSMNREYQVENISLKLSELQFIFPKIKIGTDVIVGFPGEDEYDFSETIEFLKKHHFDWIYAHKYQPIKGTVSYKLNNTISSDEIDNRILRLYKEIKNVACFVNSFRINDALHGE